MPYTIDNVIDRSREILQDVDKDRYADGRLVSALNLAISSMQRVRPDIPSLFASIPNYPYSESNLGQGIVLPVADMFYEPLSAFVAGWAELADDEFTVDARANILLTRFTSQLTVGG